MRHVDAGCSALRRRGAGALACLAAIAAAATPATANVGFEFECIKLHVKNADGCVECTRPVKLGPEICKLDDKKKECFPDTLPFHANRKFLLAQVDGFKVETDGAKDNATATLELVLDNTAMRDDPPTGFPLTDEGRKRFESVLHRFNRFWVELTMRALGWPFRRSWLLMDHLDNSELEYLQSVMARNTVLIAEPSPDGLTCFPQATLGIRLDQLATFLANSAKSADLFNYGDVAWAEKQARSAVQAEKACPTPDSREKLVGLVALLAIYVARAESQSPREVLKNITPVMARTDFATISSLLPEPQRLCFQKNPDAWVTLVLDAAKPTVAGEKSPLFAKHPDVKVKELTRGLWLRSMIGKPGEKGEDKLNDQWSPEFESLGGIGSRTDPGIDEKKQAIDEPVFELRAVRPPGMNAYRRKTPTAQLPVDFNAWSKFALAVFDYARDVQQGGKLPFAAGTYAATSAEPARELVQVEPPAGADPAIAQPVSAEP